MQHRCKEVNFQQDVELIYKSHPRNRAPTQYFSDNSDSVNENVPLLCNRCDHDNDLSMDSEVCLITPPQKHVSPCLRGEHLKNETSMTTNSTAMCSTIDSGIDLILGEIEIRINGGNILPQNEIEQQMLLTREEDESAAIGGSMDMPKFPNTIHIFGCNLNGIKTSNLHSQLQHSLDLDVDIQCYFEVNANFMNSHVHQQFHEGTKRSYQFFKSTWGTSQAISDSNFKAGGMEIVTRASCSTRVKKEATDNLKRWTCQILDGKGKRDVLIMSIYQCCTSKNKTKLFQPSDSNKFYSAKWIGKILIPLEISVKISWH